MFHRNIKALLKKLTSRVAMLRRIAVLGWDVDAKTLQIADPQRFYTPQLSIVHRSGVLVLSTLVSLQIFSMTQCALSLDACTQHKRTTYQF